MYVAWNATIRKVLEFIGQLLLGDPCLTWEKLEEWTTEEFANEGAAIEAMRALKLTQLKDEIPPHLRELGTRVEKLAILAFPEANTVMQAQLADLYVEALSEEHIHHNVLKEGPLKLSVAVVKVFRKRIQVQGREVDRQVEVELDEWEEVCNRRTWMLGHRFYKPTSGRLRLTCLTCHEGHRSVDGPTRWGLAPNYDKLRCTIR